MSFAENLKAIRKNHQLLQEELAELLEVSRQAVSKWELGEGYPEVEKLIVLSKELNVSIDSLLLNGGDDATPAYGNDSGTLRIISPNEGVILRVSKVMRSHPFKGGKNSPKYALFASDGNDTSFWGASNTFLAWYRNLEDITREIDEIRNALETGKDSYSLQYSVKCKQNLLRAIEE